MHSFRKYDVSKDDCIIVGSTIVSLISGRAWSIDIAIRPDKYKKLLKFSTLQEKLIKDSGTIDLDPDFQILLNRYSDIRVLDEKLFEDINLTMQIDGIKFAIFEIEMAKKISRNYDKDLTDVDLFLNWAKTSDKWNWSYLELAKPFSRQELIRRGINRLLKNPIVALRKVQDALVHKLASGVNRQLKVDKIPMQLMDVGVLIQLQSKNGILVRYDIIVRKLLADAVLSTRELKGSNPDPSSELKLYETMQIERIGRISTTRFMRLLDNMKNHGYDLGRYPIYLNRHGNIYDGSHRLQPPSQ